MTRSTQAARPAAPSAAARAARSPCIAVCRMEPDTGLCAGCLRTLDEIAAWGAMPQAERLRVWDLIDRRRAARGPHPEQRP